MSRGAWSPEKRARVYHPARLLARLEAKRHVTESGCWEWTGHRNADGYGHIYIGDRGRQSTHRLAYELLVGPIPDGLHIDHLCRNRACHNPEHLEPVTVRENTLRGEAPNVVTVRTNVCRRGHDMADAYVNPRGQRYCRTCLRASQRASYAKRRAAHE